jgi:type II secretory pathway pseudopilin PulG
MRSLPQIAIPDPSAEHGFTLLELLMGMVTSIVVVGALFAILEISLTQASRIADRTQADQAGRNVMNKVIDELHSSCTGLGSTAIRAPSASLEKPLESTGSKSLWYLSAYGNSSSGNAVIEKVVEHDLVWSANAKKSNTGKELGTLMDYAFTGSGSAPNFTFPTLKAENATKTVLSKTVIPPESSSEIFQYYTYENKASSSTKGQLVLHKSGETISEATAKEIAKVTVTFTQAPESEDTRVDRTASFSSSVVFRFDPTEATSEENVPCQ